MKKDAQLANEIKKLQYQLSYSEHISTYFYIQTRNYHSNLPSSQKKQACPLAGWSLQRTSTWSMSKITSRNSIMYSHYSWPINIKHKFWRNNSSNLKKIVIVWSNSGIRSFRRMPFSERNLKPKIITLWNQIKLDSMLTSWSWITKIWSKRIRSSNKRMPSLWTNWNRLKMFLKKIEWIYHNPLLIWTRLRSSCGSKEKNSRITKSG